jgi:hypothetical protein
MNGEESGSKLPHSKHHHGTCLKTPKRIKSAARNAARTAQVSSDNLQRFVGFAAFSSALISILLTL